MRFTAFHSECRRASGNLPDESVEKYAGSTPHLEFAAPVCAPVRKDSEGRPLVDTTHRQFAKLKFVYARDPGLCCSLSLLYLNRKTDIPYCILDALF